MPGDDNVNLVLWSDEPATTDLLSFDAVAETVVDGLFDETLGSVALGVSGSWGSGKTTVLNLIEKHVSERSVVAEKTILIVRADPWRYDPAVGPKESLITEILGGLQNEFRGTDPEVEAAQSAFRKLAKRVNWSKAIKMTTKTALTAQLPTLDSILELVSDEPDKLESGKTMDEFRKEFQSLLQEPALAHIAQVVVLVDDLDRCLPDTVVETLEAIRLFLSADGMSFVIAADEQRVAEAIQQKLKAPAASSESESTASLYLHKIVQTTVPVPTLSSFDTHAYLFLLLAKAEVPTDIYNKLVQDCADLRVAARSLDDLPIPDGHNLSLQMATASRLTPILYEKFHGNPRRIKRFMNDLYVRQSVAAKRGIILGADAIAKLMLVEKLLEQDFDDILKWLATGKLRERLEALQQLAQGEEVTDEGEQDTSDTNNGIFSSTIVRWAKLPPALDANDVTGYLTLAASFKGRLLIDDSLPEGLRDMVAALTSPLQLDRDTVTDNEIERLPSGDVVVLLNHLGRRMQDDPSLQLQTATAIIRIGTLHQGLTNEAITALCKLPGQNLRASTVLLLRGKQGDYSAVLDSWTTHADANTARAISTVRRGN